VRIWDAGRDNKVQVMMAMEKEEVVKARLLGANYLLAATPSSLKLYDVRKPTIILKEHAIDKKMCEDENELNDFDVRTIDASTISVASCFDSGFIQLHKLDLNTLSLEETGLLQHKHTNICLKTQFSKSDPNVVYSLGFDYKIILWNIADVSNKSQSRNIAEILQNEIGAKALEFNPPFGYSLLNYANPDG
jgi:WD40 repeat protein